MDLLMIVMDLFIIYSLLTGSNKYYIKRIGIIGWIMVLSFHTMIIVQKWAGF